MDMVMILMKARTPFFDFMFEVDFCEIMCSFLLSQSLAFAVNYGWAQPFWYYRRVEKTPFYTVLFCLIHVP